jgi:hypothetical protein
MTGMMLSELLYSWQCMDHKTLRETAKLIGIDHNTLHRFVNEKPIEGKPLAKIVRWALSDSQAKTP